VPTSIEFWQGRPSRLHDRIVYRGGDQRWTIARLAP
jgi:pyridoxamine 5'-phosphate oxidase